MLKYDLLFRSQGRQRINLHRSTRGQVTCQQCSKQKQKESYGKSRGIGCRYTVQQTREQPPESQRADQPGGGTDDHRIQPLYKDQSQHVPAVCTECDPNTDLLRSLRNSMRDYTVNSHHCEQQSKRAESSKQQESEAPRGN